MNPRDIKKQSITWTANKSQPIWVGDFRDVVLTIVGTGTATVLATASKEVVDFTAASTIGNAFATMVIADMTAASTYATSLVVAGATKLGEVNTNLVGWVCITRSADTLDGYLTYCDNS
jgi:hypothetical protein